MIADRLIATAPTLMGRSNPQWTRTPAATGIAAGLASSRTCSPRIAGPTGRPSPQR
jgi:hypothetical protein